MKKYYSVNYEKNAKWCLVTLYDSNLNNLVKSESPDWHNSKLSIGLEVVNAMSEQDGQKNVILNEFFGKKLDAEVIIKKVNRKYPKWKNTIKNHDGIAYVEETYSFAYIDKIKLIESALNKKTKLLNTNYTIFKNNWLFIFSNKYIISELDIQLLMNRYIENVDVEKVSFNRVFVLSYDKLFVIDDFLNFIEIQISDAEMREMNLLF